MYKPAAISTSTASQLYNAHHLHAASDQAWGSPHEKGTDAGEGLSKRFGRVGVWDAELLVWPLRRNMRLLREVAVVCMYVCMYACMYVCMYVCV